MSFDKSTMRRVASLARIELEDSELAEYTTRLSTIMSFIETLNEVDISDVEPMVSVIKSELKMRSDEVSEGNNSQIVLSGAPEREGDYFKVPKIIE